MFGHAHGMDRNSTVEALDKFMFKKSGTICNHLEPTRRHPASGAAGGPVAVGAVPANRSAAPALRRPAFLRLWLIPGPGGGNPPSRRGGRPPGQDRRRDQVFDVRHPDRAGRVIRWMSINPRALT